MQNRVINLLEILHDEYEHDIFSVMHDKNLIYQDENLHLDTIRQFASCLKRLNDVIKDKNIHLGCGIFEDYLLSILKLDKHTLTKEIAQEIIPFNQPENDQWHCSIVGLFRYFRINYKTENLGWICLQNKKDLEDIATYFKSWFAELSPHHIDKYQLKSLYLLQNVARYKSTLFSKEIADELNHKGSTISKTELQLLQLVTQLVGITTIVGSQEPHFYLQTVQKKIDELLSSIYFSKKHDWLLQNVTNYLRYNQNYQIVASCNEHCLNDFEAFFAPHKISVHDTDVIEETLLKAAGVELPQSIHCMLNLPSSYDTGKRVKLRFNGLSLEYAEKLKEYLIQHDHTAHLQQGTFQTHWLENARWPREKVETINITLNPKTFNQVIVPIIKKTFLEQLKQKDPCIEQYQKTSEKSLTAKAEVGEEEKAKKYSYDPKLFSGNNIDVERTSTSVALISEIGADEKNTVSM